MNIFILDGITILVFAMFVFLGFKDGIAKSLISFIGSVFSLIFSIYISSIMSQFIYDSFIEGNLRDNISQMISARGNVTGKQVLDELPNFINNSLKINGIGEETVSMVINKNDVDIINSLLGIFAPSVKGVIRSIFSILIFWMCMIVIGVITKNIFYVFKLPILKQINGILGGVFGFFKGYIIIAVIAIFLKMILPIVQSNIDFLPDKDIDSTMIFSRMYKNGLVNELYNSINIFVGART